MDYEFVNGARDQIRNCNDNRLIQFKVFNPSELLLSALKQIGDFDVSKSSNAELVCPKHFSTWNRSYGPGFHIDGLRFRRLRIVHIYHKILSIVAIYNEQ